MIDASVLTRKNFNFVLSGPEESVRLKLESGRMTATTFDGKIDDLKAIRMIPLETEKLTTVNREGRPCLEVSGSNHYHR